ncbi:phenylalanine--tRNA ligase, mitochondrial-like [Mya arenaria]|uniref:phenylalanine--tRNA ligase, mitochondrial-like n=1 Tax=Mya arenaria TaxID=6604 RepID=UPI0022E21DD6|nr:phenylalanine--tRNA ligase, mitochondrial-like [Mya arenaria]
MFSRRTLVAVLAPVKHLRCLSKQSAVGEQKVTSLLGKDYKVDSWTNTTPSILEKVGTNLHTQKDHPLCLLNERIKTFFYKSFTKRGNPIFSVYDNESPVVTLKQNFDNLLVEENHPSRNQADSYYLNSEYMLRAHTTAHQREFIRAGLNSFLISGDVYRRDTIDKSHYPVFHQVDGVKLFSKTELFGDHVSKPDLLELFGDTELSPHNQAGHTVEAALTVQTHLKNTLEDLASALFGKDIKTRWVDAYFPFTHPSWELEIWYQDDWLEVLGCGVMQQQILNECGADSKVGWAFGMGMERLAMKLYNIPDIRLFWNKDPRFLDQFKSDDPDKPITFQPFSTHPPCHNDISFWVPTGFQENDFYDIVRSCGGNIVEQVELIDVYNYTKLQKTSHCYRVIYRHPSRALQSEEVDEITKLIKAEAETRLNVTLR